MATRNATAQWIGTLQEGNGTMSFGTFTGPYTFKSRFEEGEGTNPEELIGAAEAGCFSMWLGNVLAQSGTPAESVETQARVHLRQVDEKPTIAQIDLVTRGRVPGIDQARFEEAAREAKENCVISRALAGVTDITLEATLES